MSRARVKIPSGGGTPYALDIEDEGLNVVTDPTALNFTGAGVTVTENPAGVAEIDIPGSTPYALDIEDEGLNVVSNPTALNFTGAGVTVTENPTGVAEIDIPGNPITVSDEGTPVVANPLFINFAGAGVAVTNNPIGTALVTIPADGVQFWTESESAATQQNTRWTPNNVAANVTAVIQPKGNGALTAQRPDGTTVGGNARGTNAIDLQMSRTNANQVAGAANSVIAGGINNSIIGSTVQSVIGGGAGNTINSGNAYNTIAGGQNNSTPSGWAAIGGGIGNTVSGGLASIPGGNTNTASGTSSFATNDINIASGINSFAFGRYAIANLRGQVAQGGGSPGGRFQQSTVLAWRQLQSDLGTALSSGGTAVLSLDGTGTTNLIIPNGNNRTWNVVASWVAVVRSITGTATGVSVGDVITQCNLFAFKRVGGTSSIVGSITSVATHNDASMATASMAYTAGGSEELAITFTAPTFAGGGSLNMQLICKLMLSEVAY